jgi:hypothetical protein
MIVSRQNSLLLLLLFYLWFPVMAFCQHGYLMNQKVLNLDEINYGVTVVSGQNEFLMFGDVLVDNVYSDYLLNRLVNDSIIDWSQTYGGTLSETFNAVLPLGDSGYILAGSAASADGDLTSNYGIGDCWLVRMDREGNILWQKNYGGSGYDRADDIISVDGGYAVIGSTRSNDVDVSFNHGEADVWLFRVDESGNLLWEKSFGGSESDNGRSVIAVGDSVMMIFGSTKSTDGDVKENHGNTDYWLIEYSITGDSIVWEKTFGGEESDAGTDMIMSRDGSYLLVGNSRTGESGLRNNGENDYRIIKVDELGDVIWDHSFGGSLDEIAANILVADGEGYLISGYAYSNDGDVTGNHGGRDMWIVKINESGKLVWQYALGGMYHDVANGAVVCADGGYRIVGSAISKDGDVVGHLERKMDTWTVKLCEDYFIKELANICEGEQFEWEGELYSEPGIYEKSFLSRCGFDSIRQLKLVINGYPDNFEIEGESAPYIGRAFEYSAPLIYNNVYHWYVENGTVIETPAFNKIHIEWGIGGSGTLKAVAQSAGGCESDTSVLEVTIIGEALEENGTDPVIIYPNPVIDYVIVEGKTVLKVDVFTIKGRALDFFEKTPEKKSVRINTSTFSPGIYYLKIYYRNSRVQVRRIVKL